jgi:hypothetical protein
MAFAVYPWNYPGKMVGPPNIKVSRLLPETGYFRCAAAGSRVVAEGHFLVELPMYPANRVIWCRKTSALFEQRKVGVEHDYGADFVVVCNAGSDSRKVYNNRMLNFSIRLPANITQLEYLVCVKGTSGDYDVLSRIGGIWSSLRASRTRFIGI